MPQCSTRGFKRRFKHQDARNPTNVAGVIATLASFIGVGRHGTVIVRGLALYDKSIILAEALPAAIMSLAIYVVSKCSTVF